MVVVGCTGGIGSGKSTVTSLLARHGARVIDADLISRQVTDPGTKVHEAIVARFGSGIVTAEGAINRPALGAIVFADDAALGDLERIIHPAVEEIMHADLAAARRDGADVICDIPLLVEIRGRQLYNLDVVIVVDVPEELAVERLARDRGMSEDEARRRMSAQIGRFDRLAEADAIIENTGTLDELTEMVDEVWRWIAHLGPNSVPVETRAFRPIS